MNTTLATERSTDVAEFLRLLHPEGSVFEIRSPNCPTKPGDKFKPATASGYFCDHVKALAAIRTLDTRKPPGIYVTLNPCKLDLLARAANRIESRAETTTGDDGILGRNWLLIDVDPSRSTGVSSTDSQMESALALVRMIRRDLAEEEWPEPIYGMSGNGAYLIYRIDLPNDEAAKELVKGVLVGLAERFDQPEASLDCSTFNASRIAKVFGTTARKGDDMRNVPGMEDRPHRVAWFEKPEVPLGIVSEALLRSVAKIETAPTPTKTSNSNGQHLAADTRAVEWCRKYIAKLDPAIDGQHGSDPTFHAACECWRFGLSDSDAWALMTEWNASHAQPPWSEKELRHKLDSARKKIESKGEFGNRLSDRRDNRPHESNGAPTKASASEHQRDDDAKPIVFEQLTSAELAAWDKQVCYIIKDVWAAEQGGIVSGRFKTLKTSFVVAMGISASLGVDLFGRFYVARANRIGIMSAESGLATLKERGLAIADSMGVALADCGNLIWSTSSPRLARADHLAALKRFILENGLEGLIIDPTYLALCDIGSDATNVFKMGAVLAPLTEMIQDTGCSIVLVNHNTKGRAKDVAKYAPPDLAEVSMSGFMEWARFWCLLGPRQEWDEEAGQHWLYLRTGGSAGHAGLWHLDVTEGKRSDPDGRRWEVSVVGASEGQRQADAARTAAKADAERQQIEDDKRAIIDAMREMTLPDSETAIRRESAINGQRFAVAFKELKRQGGVVKVDIRKGNNRNYPGFQFAPDEEE